MVGTRGPRRPNRSRRHTGSFTCIPRAARRTVEAQLAASIRLPFRVAAGSRTALPASCAGQRRSPGAGEPVPRNRTAGFGFSSHSRYRRPPQKLEGWMSLSLAGAAQADPPTLGVRPDAPRSGRRYLHARMRMMPAAATTVARMASLSAARRARRNRSHRARRCSWRLFLACSHEAQYHFGRAASSHWPPGHHT